MEVKRQLAFVDADLPGVGPAVACGQEFREYHRNLDAVGRGQQIELQRMAFDRQVLLVRRALDRPVA